MSILEKRKRGLHLTRMKAKSGRETITAIEASTDTPQLIRVK